MRQFLSRKSHLTEEGGLGFWDRTLATIAVCGAVGAFIDFYIGKPGQRRVGDRLEMWWLRLSDVCWGNFGRGEALFAVQVMDRIFGRRIFAALARTGDGGASSLRLSERQNA
jgi:hypothetical protein